MADQASKAVAVATFLGLVVSACGGGSHSARRVHLNGQATGNYVAETSASGTTFLLPAADVAQQSVGTFEVVNAANDRPSNSTPIADSSLYNAIVGSATTVVPRDAHVELITTGTPGLQLVLQWTDTCGANGGDGRRVLRSPAVVNLTLPPSTGNKTCYVAVMARARTFRPLHLGILDH